MTAEHEGHQPAAEERPRAEKLRRQQGREENQHAAEGVGVDGGADGADRVRRVILDVAQRAVAARVVEAGQGVEDAHRPLLGDDVERDTEDGRARAGQHQHPAGPLQIFLLANDVDHHEEEQDAQRDLGETADGGDAGPGVGSAQGEGEDRQNQEGGHGQPHGRADQAPIAAGQQPHSPDEDEGRQGRVQEGRLEAQAEGEGGEGQQRGHQDDEGQPPAWAAQGQVGGHQPQAGGNRQQRAQHGDDDGRQRWQRTIKARPARPRPRAGWGERANTVRERSSIGP